MERLQEILAGLNCTARTSEMTEEELEQFRADSYNSNPGNLDEADGHNCKTCLNKGWIMRAGRDDRGNWTTFSGECKCMAIRRTIRRMQRSGLKNIIRDYTFDKFLATEDWQKAIKGAAMEYAKNPEGWFFIGGQSGAGKSHICTAICREFLLGGREVKYMLWRDDIVQLKGAVTDAEQYGSLMDQYKRIDILYIDDLFKTGKGPDGAKQHPTAADVNAAFEILNYRYNDPKKLTIISSECTIDDLLEIDEAVGGRIFERAKVISLRPDKSRNYRLRGAIEL